MKVLAILGSGDLGRQIAHYAISDNHYDKVVFFDDVTLEKEINGYPVLGNSETIEKEFLNKSFDELIIALGYKHLEIKKQLYERFNSLIPFGRIVHSSSWIDETTIIKDGCVIYPRCSIDANVVINENTIINIGGVIAHDTKIGKHCFLSPRVAIAGFVNVDEMCILGINSTIIDNLNVIAKTQIGGGTVVIKNIDKKGLYVGNPMRFIR